MEKTQSSNGSPPSNATRATKMQFLTLVAAACLAVTAVAAEEKKVVCYFGSWAVYRPGAGKFAIEDIEPSLCTHLIYTFVGLVGDNIKVLDAWQDLPDEWGKDGFGRFNALRERSPSTKTLIAIGGWNEGSSKYSTMAANPTSRSNFVRNAVTFVKKYNFDGFDLDWEYPGQRGGVPADVQNFVLLVKEMRAAFDKEGLLLTAAVGAAKSSASQSYNIPEVSKYLHFINLMTYDLHGSWESSTGINAPLYPSASETGNARQLNVDASVKYWLDAGAPAEKLILGVASYGRSFTLVDSKSSKVGAAARGPGTAGPYTREKGMLGYNEICTLQNEQQWHIHFDEERRVPYAHRENEWVGYDNVQSIQEKAEYINKMGLGGAMVWSIETDDFRGKCGDKYPIIGTLNYVLRKGKPVFDRPPNPPKETEKPAPPHSTTPNTGNNNNHNHHVGSGECTGTGNFADPTNCEHFFQCVALGDGTYSRTVVQCADGLCYKPESGICDWK